MSGAPRTAGTRDTRARLIDVAERLFAEYGVESVSLRTVGVEAGQRNNSAAQYHFGSKAGLIAAIIAARSAAVDARRAELVAALWARPEPPAELEPLLNLLVLPLAETIAASPGRTWYLRFLANVMDHPMLAAPWSADAASVPERSAPPDPPGLRHLRRELRRRLPGLPDAEFERRLRWVMITTFRLLADHERQRAAAAPGAPAPPVAQVVADLNRMLVALLEAPHPVPDPVPDPAPHPVPDPARSDR